MKDTQLDSALEGLITNAQRDAVMAPIERARTLPSSAYADERWFELEQDRIFARNWVAVAFECELPEPGDAAPLELFGQPLLALRGDDGELRVFHNVCPFDGCLVVRHAVRGLEELEVLYHGWRYDLRGRLTAAPFWNGHEECGRGDMQQHQVDLIEVRSCVRLGALLINLDGRAPPVDQWLEPWLGVVGGDYAVERLVPARDGEGKPLIEKRTVAANWKTYQENASINILHEAFTHQLYRESPEVPRVDAQGNARFELYMDGTAVIFRHSRDDSGQTYDEIRLPSAGHDPSVNPANGFFSTLYPNINVPLLDSMIKVNLVIPRSASLTELHHLRFYSPEALALPTFEREEQAVQKLFDVVHYEDQLAIEAVQKGRACRAVEQLYYAPFWDGLHHRFNQLVMMDMERA